MTTALTGLRMLNLGCGAHYHPAWVNLDLRPQDSAAQRFDVTRPLPFAAASFDVVYHSHLLEHLPRPQALPFLRECRRILCDGGVLRIAVPDLEAIARLYLQSLEAAWNEDDDAQREHRWLTMELYDQATREATGGAMLSLLQSDDCALAWFRLGSDGRIIRQRREQLPFPPTWRTRLKAWLFGSWRERLIRWLLGPEYPLLKVGRFRRSGEVHHWMYDRVALRDLLAQSGFVDFRCVAAAESSIPSWTAFRLDTDADGSVRKPDSLFVEASAAPSR